jgi:peptidoglycan/LPS O-acetylase OafA/YrhL
LLDRNAVFIIRMSSTGNGSSPEGSYPLAGRLLFLDALRAFASLLILWHHFALYPPLASQAEPLLGPLVHWFADYARATQVFFVIGGYVMARSLSGRKWDIKSVGGFLAGRYCRLGIPYLSACVMAIAASAWGRGWLSENVTGAVPTAAQGIAHVFFLQDLLGYEHFSAGLWFVCINFQLGLIYAATLWLRDTLLTITGRNINVPMIAGWILSTISLFHFNRHPEWDSWALYFFPYFFMGIIVHRALKNRRSAAIFWIYQIMILAAMCHDWRWRLASALVVGLLLFGAEKTGLSTRWPKSRWIARMGKTSYSLFLVHFPVLVLVAGAWARLGWTSPPAAVAGLLTAFAASVAISFAFHRHIEKPAAQLSRRWGKAEIPTNSNA